MSKLKILLGLTGSVASTLADKILKAMQQIGEVKIVVTEHARSLLPLERFASLNNGETTWDGSPVYTDANEWSFPSETAGWSHRPWQKGDRVLHIELRQWADVLVIAPLSANTLAKMANGICDNLLTSVVRCWDLTKPVVVAPAMNTLMWEHPVTSAHLRTLIDWFDEPMIKNFIMVQPIEKGLACGEKGVGAMAMIDDIAKAVDHSTDWIFPLTTDCSGIPINFHPGAFGFHRKHSYHTGVDLYTNNNAAVYAVEPGVVVAIEPFTGPQDGSPWWQNTEAVLVEGRTGVVCYGEITPRMLSVGQRLPRGGYIGSVKQVLRTGKERPDIPGHSLSMLHFELYKHGTRTCSKSWKHDQPMHSYMTDPTPYLMDAIGAPKGRLVWENPQAMQGGDHDCGCEEKGHHS